MNEQSLVLKEKALQKLELYPEDSRKIAEGLMLSDRSIASIDFMINDTEKYISYLIDKISNLNMNS